MHRDGVAQIGDAERRGELLRRGVDGRRNDAIEIAAAQARVVERAARRAQHHLDWCRVGTAQVLGFADADDRGAERHHGVGASSVRTRRSRKDSIAVSSRPSQSPSTAALCCPSRGAGPRTPDAAAEKR